MAPLSKKGQELKKTKQWTLQNLNPITQNSPFMLLY
jgi:hypothetical protein